MSSDYDYTLFDFIALILYLSPIDSSMKIKSGACPNGAK